MKYDVAFSSTVLILSYNHFVTCAVQTVYVQNTERSHVQWP